MQESINNQNYPDIPGYKILSELGRGGIATVYLALQESLDRQVALKVMSPLLAMEPDYAERFIREGRTVAQLSHPNIITVYDIGLQKHQLFIAMEYIPGGNMRTLMMEHENDPEWALSVAGQIALALGYAHTIGIVHRDVKPENILFRESGAAVLTDFGIAKTITSNTNLTRAGTIIGTPKYMSPEQTDGVGNDPTTDIYSLGIILYEMLTGQVPYDSENSMAVLYAHVNSPIPELPKELSDLQPLLNNLLAKKAEERTDDCDELAEIIRITRRERHYALKNPEKMEKMKDTGLATDLIQPVKKKSRAKRRRKKSETKAANIIESLKGVFSIADGKHGNNGRLKQIGLGLLGVVIVFSLISIWTGGPDDAAEEANSDLQSANNTASDGNDNSIQKYIDSKNQQPETAATLSGPDTITPVDEPATLDNAIENESPVADESVAEKIDDNLADDDTQAEVVAEKEIDSAQTDQTEILISRFLADESHDELVKQNLAMAPRNEEEEKETAALATRQKEINGLLTKARRAVKDERITTPKDDNAVSYYKQVLELSPRNSRALRGLNVSGDLIYEQIKEKYASDDQDLALRQINATLLSIPNHIKLTALKKSIEASFNPNSSYAKAEKLYRGVDGTKNPSRAAFYYLKAAELGHIQAMNAIGVAYADGDGVVHSDRRAMNWFKKSAQYGNSEAMYNAALGYLFSNVKDPSKAWNWAKKSSDNEYRPAYMLAGWMKTTGTGTRANRFGSIGWDLKGMVNPISSKLDKQYRIPEKWQDIFMVEYRATTNTGPP